MAQAEHLLCKFKDLSSNSSPTKTTKESLMAYLSHLFRLRFGVMQCEAQAECHFFPMLNCSPPFVGESCDFVLVWNKNFCLHPFSVGVSMIPLAVWSPLDICVFLAVSHTGIVCSQPPWHLSLLTLCPGCCEAEVLTHLCSDSSFL
jgi:hypothetical protein